MRRAFKGSKVFAVLPIPMDSPRTALVFADALTDALAKNRAAPAHIAATPGIPTTSLTPSNDRWGLGAGVAVLIVACAWFIARDKETAVSSAARTELITPPAQAPLLNGRIAAAPATAAQAAQEKPGTTNASATDAATGEVAGSTASAADHPSLAQAHLTLIHYVAPEYPAAARARNMGGTVIVAYTVDAQGATRYVRVVSAAPAEIFNHDAVDAVKRWRYAPAMVDNAAVAVPTRSTIRFTPQ
jgi:protein TonB